MNKSREAPIQIVVRKKRHTGGHHGGAWKVALADFMTAMFSLFLVLWLVNQSSDVKAAIAGYFADPLGRSNESGSSIVPGEGAPLNQMRMRSQSDVLDMQRDMLRQKGRELENRLAQAPDLESVRPYVKIEMTEDGLRIELMESPGGIFFESGNAVPSPRGAEVLALLGSELGTLPNSVRIEGHTDAYPYRGDGSYTNWELSADRANTARRILTGNGMREGQVTQVIGLADRQPREGADPYDALNRRITITMLLGGEISPPQKPADVLRHSRTSAG
ncbi:MAG: flagellar motor protein MotB [Candidatus Eisenbacteria bacterium]